MIAEATELSDHFGGACPSGLQTYCRAAFVVTHTLVQNLPYKPTKTMSDCPDSLFETEARQ
jgi:hypothetical protein